MQICNERFPTNILQKCYAFSRYIKLIFIIPNIVTKLKFIVNSYIK